MTIDYGTAWSCVDDLTMPAVMVSGFRCIGEAIARRLQTERGTLIDDPNYGFALTDYVNDDLTARALARLQNQVETECTKDERVTSAVASVVLTTAGVLTTTITLTTAAGPFTLVLAVGDVTVEILRVSP